MTTNKIGILLTNTGTPDDPSIKSVRSYLREFLSDRRIIHVPSLIWQPILHGIILRSRPRRSAHLYQKIWTKAGAPMRIIMQKIAAKLAQQSHCHVEIGMNYGNPKISLGLEKLRQKEIQQLIVLPLYPQYSNTTTASSYDRVMHALKQWKILPQINFINHYVDHPDYIAALAANTKALWNKQGKGEHLLISFHGIPKRHVRMGDPYELHCQLTANRLASALNLSQKEWTLCYQSRFGIDLWLTPSTQTLLRELPRRGMKEIDIICPGFAVDCLETLEEIVIRGKDLFKRAGGKSLHYIPALNDQDEHIGLLAKLIGK